jgi:hypothetical protein
MQKKVPIRYTSRDFNSIKTDLVEYARRYYPDTINDFTQASFASLVLDSVAYVGDILSFYLDYQVNESFLDTAIERENIIKIARQMGYKLNRKPLSYGTIAIYVLVPASSVGLGIDTAYIPIIVRGSSFTSVSGTRFTLIEDIDFSKSRNKIVPARLDETTGKPTFYAIKAYGTIVSGEEASETINIGDYQRFRKVALSRQNIVEIISVIDSEGKEYYEVDNLSQDVVMKEVKNIADSTNGPSSIMKMIPVPRRFVVENDINTTYLQFGYGSDNQLTDDTIAEPSQAVLQLHGRDYISDSYFDPSDIIKTDKFGVTPVNTTLTITYRIANSEFSNAAPNSITRPTDVRMRFKDRGSLSNSIVSEILGSIECTNDEPIVGDITNIDISVDELKTRVNNFYSAQGRAVTKQDYTSLIYSMSPKFGAIKRCNVVEDNNSFKRNINIYVISEDSNGFLTQTNSIIKQNLKTYLSNYKMINDTIDILDVKIVNIGIEYQVVGVKDFPKQEVIRNCILTLNNRFGKKFDIGEPISISDIYTELSKTTGVSDVISVDVVLKTGTGYSDTFVSLKNLLSQDGRFLRCPKNVIFEIKSIINDTKGTVV